MKKKARYKNKNIDKERAILEGRNWYVGSMHKCGGVIRYLRGNCVYCERIRGRKLLNEGVTDAYKDRKRKKRNDRIQLTKLTPEERRVIVEVYKRAREMSVNTGIPHEVDHIIPLSRGGLHHPSNLQILTRDENKFKGAK